MLNSTNTSILKCCLVMAAGVLALAACANRPDLQPTQPESRTEQGGLVLSLAAAQDSYPDREPIPVRVVLRNTGRKWVHIPTFEEGSSFYEWYAATPEGKLLTEDRLMFDTTAGFHWLRDHSYQQPIPTLGIPPCKSVEVETHVNFPFMSREGQPRWQGPVLVHLVYHPEKAERVANTDLYPEKLEAEVVLWFGAGK